MKPSKVTALCLAILTTLLWSGSYIVNKIAFAEGIPAITLAGIRYTCAGIVLMALLRKPAPGKPMPLKYSLLQGVLCYFIGQGLQYVGQSRLVPTLSSLMINSCMMVVIVVADLLILKESRGKTILIKLLVMIAGMVLYYQPWTSFKQSPDMIGIVVMLIASVGAAMNIFLNRYMLTQKGIESNSLLTRPMLVGGILMLIAGLLTHGLPPFSLTLVMCVMYLALVSGALAYFIWVWSQKTLSSPQSGAINSGMIIEIALLDVLFFGRELNLLNWLGLILTFLAIVWIQLQKTKKISNA